MSNNPYYIDPTAGRDPNALPGLSRSLTGLGQILQQKRDQTAAQQKQVQQQEEAQSVLNSGDPKQISAFMVKNPEMAAATEKAFGITNDQTKQLTQELSAQLLSAEDPEQAANLIDQYLPQVSNAGGSPLHLANAAIGLRSGDQSLNQVKSVAMMLNPDLAKQMQAGKTGGGVGTVSPKDFTVESLAEYEASGEIGDLVRYTPKVQDIAGIPHQLDQGTGKWEPLVDMNDPRISEQAKRLAELEADKQSRLDFGKDKSKFMKDESKTIAKIDSARGHHKIMVDTANRIKSLMSGWNTKYGSSLSFLKGSEARELKNLINTMKANSAFSTLVGIKQSGGTLGAISAPELVLLEAKLGAIDQGGEIPEQVRVIDQILTANQTSINRLDNAYNMDKQRYSGDYDSAAALSAERQEQQSTNQKVKVDF